jgi:hypothetical protein
MDPNNAGNAAPPAGAPTANVNSAPNQVVNQPGQTVPLAELMKEREQRQSMQAEVEALKSTVASLANRSSAPSAPAPSQPDVRAQLEDMWREDPRKAMQMEMSLAMQWRDQVDVTVESAMSNAASKYADFGNYQNEVKHYLRQLPLEQRASPGVVDAAYYMVKGSKADELIKAGIESGLKKLNGAEYSSGISGGSSGGGQGQPNTTILNADQKQIASAMGMSDEDYMKHMR